MNRAEINTPTKFKPGSSFLWRTFLKQIQYNDSVSLNFFYIESPYSLFDGSIASYIYIDTPGDFIEVSFYILVFKLEKVSPNYIFY